MNDSEKVINVKRISKNWIKEDGTIKSFTEQLLEYKYGLLTTTEPLVVSADSQMLGTLDLADYPLTIHQAIIKKIETKHDIAIDKLLKLPELIQDYVIAFESKTEEKGRIVILDEKDKNGSYILMAIHKDKTVKSVSVNAIRSIYSKEKIEELIRSTYKAGLKFFPNEKTDDWLISLGIQFPNDKTSHLSINYNTQKSEKSQEVRP